MSPSPSFKKDNLLTTYFTYLPTNFPRHPINLSISISAYDYLLLQSFPPQGLVSRSFSPLNPQCLVDYRLFRVCLLREKVTESSVGPLVGVWYKLLPPNELLKSPVSQQGQA